MSQCLVRKVKFDRSISSEWEGERLKSADSDWLLVLHDPDRHAKFSDGQLIQADQYFIHCHSRSEPLTVLLGFNDGGKFLHAKCDAALPTTQDDTVITFVDLDLDVMVAADFSWELRDEDTFAQNRISMAYPAHVVEQAYRGIELAKRLVTARQFPFNDDFLRDFAIMTIDGSRKTTRT